MTVTIFKVFRNVYLQQKTKRNILKEEISITVASWIIWFWGWKVNIIQMTDRWIYASRGTSAHWTAFFWTWQQRVRCLLVIQLNNTIYIHSLQIGELDHRNHSLSSIFIFCFCSLFTLLQFRKYAALFILAKKGLIENNCNLCCITKTTEGKA